MDLQLKQWRTQQQDESENQPSAAKIPKLLFDQSQTAPSTALPLFSSEPLSKLNNNMSGFPLESDSRLPRMGSYFSLGQWQELELQALIYRYMLAGAAVPQELLQPIQKSLHHSSSFFLHPPLQHYSPYQPSWYWGKGTTDPEPGRCRRTDGKKWRCSRDVVSGHKYCERHMHRGRNRSRKPVETPTLPKPTSSTTTAVNAGRAPNGPTFFLSGSSPSSEIMHLNPSSMETQKTENHNKRSDGHILRHFFDDWPRSIQESEAGGSNASQLSSATCLSISMPGNPTASDVSLKLATGIEEEASNRESYGGREQRNMQNWGSGWGSGGHMGGPLAEALRSSTSSSPTSVLHQLLRGGISS